MNRLKTSFGQHCNKRKSVDFGFHNSLDVKDYMKGYTRNHFKKPTESDNRLISKRKTQPHPRSTSKEICHQSPTPNAMQLLFFKQNNAKIQACTPSGNSHTSIKQFNSQKSIYEKNRRLSLGTPSTTVGASLNKIRPTQQLEKSTPTHQMSTHKQHTSVNLEKHLIMNKYEKIKQLLQAQKYTQACTYLKQIIPYIIQKEKKKQLYFWLIAALMKAYKAHAVSKLQTIETHIIECLKEFPNYYDVYLYWAKVKLKMGQSAEAIRIYKQAVKINPNNSEAYKELGDLYIERGDYEEGKKIWTQGLQMCDSSVSLPCKLIENSVLLAANDQEKAFYLNKIFLICGKNSTEYQYCKGLIELFSQKVSLSEICIYFQESLKFNTNKPIATQSLENLIKIHIRKRDFYSAYYDLKRSKHLNVDFKKIDKYETFLEGVNFVMKKKYECGLPLLEQVLTKSQHFDQEIVSLAIKYLAYAHFKLGNHSQSVRFYRKLKTLKDDDSNEQMDKISLYNLVLSEGIVLADKDKKFAKSLDKFDEAKSIFETKVEPYIYGCVVKIFQATQEQKSTEELDEVVLESIQILTDVQELNNSSSNLLYHRSILKMYFQDWKSSIKDINQCIEKAEENLPKYFYLRGLCYACSKDLKKAINEFSIATSLDKNHEDSILQRAKCYFLLGETDSGFHDLKSYMNLTPQNPNIHQWIGDLLYEGHSYSDSIKAYNEMGQNHITLTAVCHRLRCELRVQSPEQIFGKTIKQIQKSQFYDQNFYKIDMAALDLLNSLNAKKFDKISIEEKLKALNHLLQHSSNTKCHILHLIDCMNIIGIASFYIGKYSEAYESFVLVLDFYRSLKSQDSGSSAMNSSSEEKQEEYDLTQVDVCYNLLLTLLSLQRYEQAFELIQGELQRHASNEREGSDCEEKNQSHSSQQENSWSKLQIKILQQIYDRMKPTIEMSRQNEQGTEQPKNKRKLLHKASLMPPEDVRLQTRIDPISFSSKFKSVDIRINPINILLKAQLFWTPFHIDTSDSYFSNIAKGIVFDLHAAYIDNMPQGPWIKRNRFGVLFTDNIIEDEELGGESFLIETMRKLDERSSADGDHSAYNEEVSSINENDRDFTHKRATQLNRGHDSDEADIETRREIFLRNMKLDLKMEDKLNKIIKKKTLQ